MPKEKCYILKSDEMKRGAHPTMSAKDLSELSYNAKGFITYEMGKISTRIEKMQLSLANATYMTKNIQKMKTEELEALIWMREVLREKLNG